MVRLIGKIGDKYGRLTIKEYLYTDDHYRKFWKCQCDCGNEHTTHTGALTQGNTRSCGCLAIETRRLNRIPGNHSEITNIILGYKRHALRRNLEWSLSRNEVIEIVKNNCYYCNEVPSNKKINKNTIEPYYYNGIDRVDNEIGYIKDNVVPCCKQCNTSKGQRSKKEFLNWVKQIYDRIID